MAEVSSELGFPGELFESGDGRGRARPQDVDRHIGARIRQRRLALGIGLPRLAELVGVTAQQAYKYERGINRVSAGRLFVIAQALAADVGFFFQGLDDVRKFDVTPQGRLLLEFVSSFVSLNEQCHQAALSSLVRALADCGARDTWPRNKPRKPAET
jgi:transcriptional regulator with XRE-family HTH domain